MQNNNFTYPELYFPSRIQELLNSKPSLPKEPTPPQEPVVPNNPGEYDSGGNRGCFGFMMFVIIVIFIVSISADKVNFQGILALIGAFLCSLFLFKTTTWDKELHERKKIEYEQSAKEYPHLLQKYKTELALYKTEYNKYTSLKTLLLSTRNIEKYRATKITYFLEHSYTAPIFQECEETDIIKKGASEDFFVEFLKKTTHWGVLVGQKVPVGSKYYYPDIIIETDGVYIDVEIDEPYVGKDGTPIHYIKHNFVKESIDKERNTYMTQHGWIVIRFAEEQIFLYPNECVEYVSNIISALRLGRRSVEVPEYFTKEKWDEKQSNKMAYKRFRRTYIPQEYLSNVDNEDYRSYADIRKEIFYDSLPF